METLCRVQLKTRRLRDQPRFFIRHKRLGQNGNPNIAGDNRFQPGRTKDLSGQRRRGCLPIRTRDRHKDPFARQKCQFDFADDLRAALEQLKGLENLSGDLYEKIAKALA